MKIQQQNEDQKWNEEQHYKNLTGGSLDFLKKDYRIVISIILISSIVFHLVSISTFDKDNG